MNTHLALILITALLIHSCNTGTTEFPHKHGILYRLSGNRFKYMDSITLFVSRLNDSSLYYCVADKDTMESLSYISNIKSDSSIIIRNFSCPLIDNKTYTINNKQFKVLKYNYDDPGIFDEKTVYFVHPYYGILAAYNYAWFKSGAVKYDDTSGLLVDSIINDKSFFSARGISQPIELILEKLPN